jgi:outer membrane lipoprotein-sorting protein
MRSLSSFPAGERTSLQLLCALCIAGFLGTASPVFADQAADALVRSIDANQVFTTEKFSAKMTVSKSGRTLVKTFTGYGAREGQRFFMSFTNPEDRGVNYLKIGNELWIYLPDAQDSLKISGHMLRQGMMGSDISYEDMLRNDSLLEKYSAELISTTNIDGMTFRRLVLTAKVEDVTYYKRVCYLETGAPVFHRLELFAKSGRLLKRMSFSDFRVVGSRNTAFRSVIRDMTRANSETVIEFSDLAYDIALPADGFSKSRLSK